MKLISDPEAAKRLARAIASDVALYNEAKIKQGIELDSFFDLLSKELQEGREHYNNKVDPQLRSKTNFYDLAIVDVILKRKGHIKSKIW
jgi:spore germination protein GerM